MRNYSYRKRKNKSKITFILTIVLIVIVFVCSTAYAYFSQDLSLRGTVNLNSNNPSCDISLFEGYNNFDVTYSYEFYNNGTKKTEEEIKNISEGTLTNVTVNVKITNTGDKTVNAWRLFLQFPLNTKYVNHWNANKVYIGNVKNGQIMVYEHPSTTFNNIIAPGDSVNFNIMYDTTSSEVKIQLAGAYGWNLETENMPTIENMASCIYDENTDIGTGGGNNPGGSDLPEVPTYATLPSTFEKGTDGWVASLNATVNTESVSINGETTQALSIKEFTEKGVKASVDLSKFEAGEYTYSAMVTRLDKESIPVQLWYSFDGGDLKEADNDGKTNPNEWVKLEGKLTIPENTKSIDLYIIYPGTSSGDTYLAWPLYVDNVKLEKVDNTPQEPVEPPIPTTDSIVASIEPGYTYDYNNNLKIYVTKLIIKNNTNSNINNWYVDVNIGEGGEAIGCWNATCSTTNGKVHITQPAWGATVNANSEITIEFHFGTKGQPPTLLGYGLTS